MFETRGCQDSRFWGEQSIIKQGGNLSVMEGNCGQTPPLTRLIFWYSLVEKKKDLISSDVATGLFQVLLGDNIYFY